jgi:hypothetical protein
MVRPTSVVSGELGRKKCQDMTAEPATTAVAGGHPHIKAEAKMAGKKVRNGVWCSHRSRRNLNPALAMRKTTASPQRADWLR